MSTMAEQELSSRTRAALQHLKRLRPLDGYAAERYLASSGRLQVRLKRRNVPVRDEGFEEIVLDGTSGNVVGVRVITSRGEAGRGVILVDKDGRLCKDDSEITVRMADVSTASARGASSASLSGSRQSSRASSSSAAAAIPTLSDEDNAQLLQYGLMAIGALLVVKIIFSVINVLSILLLPALWFYASLHCPTNDSFDAKKELKRAMRGAHLPEESQPKGFFEQGLNRLAASVTTELATSLGYDVTMTDCVGAAKLATVRVPVAGAEYYWLGVLGKWRFLGQREIPGSKND